jgi:hypothetical protein
MQISIPDLDPDFTIKGLNVGNSYSGNANSSLFKIKPGAYLLSKSGKKTSPEKYDLGTIRLNEFVAPQSTDKEIYLRHEPYSEISLGESISLKAKVVGLDSGAVSLLVNQLGNRFRVIEMKRKSINDFEALLPADLLTSGMLNYRIMVKSGDDYAVFPGNIKENPFAWDHYKFETWSTFVAAENGSLEIFNPTEDRSFRTYPVWRRGFQTSYTSCEKPGQLILKLNASDLKGVDIVGFQFSFVEKLKGRMSELESFHSIVIRARTSNEKPIDAKVSLVNSNAQTVSATVSLTTQFQDIEIPLQNFKPGSSLLMPRPYPGFLPLTFNGGPINGKFNLLEAERIEITAASGLTDSEKEKSFGLEIESIYLKK